MREILVIILSFTGSIFILLAAVGILRMPDIYMRVSATTKAVTLGVGTMLAAVAIFYQDISITSRAAAAVLFLFLTAPIAAHILSKVSYFKKVPFWENTCFDELGEDLAKKAEDSEDRNNGKTK
ncbi:MAG: monovalent cation/H(+) antiporter subunit G [Cytophagaceae bacterium]